MKYIINKVGLLYIKYILQKQYHMYRCSIFKVNFFSIEWLNYLPFSMQIISFTFNKYYCTYFFLDFKLRKKMLIWKGSTIQ